MSELNINLDDVQEELVSGTNIKTINNETLLGSGNITISGGGGDVDSVNGEVGVVVLDTDDIAEGTTNEYYTEAKVSANTDVVANTAKNSYPSADATKLAGIEAGAEVNDTADEIKTKYESNANTNAFTDAEKTNLGNQSGTNTGDQDISGIATNASAITTIQGEQTVQDAAIALNTAKNSYPSADATKLAGIETGAEVNDTAAEIKTKYESNADTNAFTDAEKSKLANQSGTNTGDQDISGIATNASAITTIQGEQTTQDAAIALNTAKNSYPSADATKLAGIETGAEVNDVNSVNGEVGVVVLDTDDVNEGTTNLYYTDAKSRNAISLVSDSSSLTYSSASGVFTYTDPTGSPAAASHLEIDVRNESGSTIAANSAVYISGVSGNNDLIELAVNTGSNPAMGVTVSSINNNSNGTMIIGGEIGSFATGSYSENDTLYLSNVAGELTNVRPTAESQFVQNIGRVVRVHSSNGTIIVQGAGRSNDVPNLNTKHVFIGNASGYEKRQLTYTDVLNTPTDTDDISEGSTNLYYTEARVSANTDVTANTAKNSYPSADSTKLAGIETGAEVNDTAAEIKTKYESNANTNAFTDAEKTTLANQSGTNTGDQDISGISTNASAITTIQGEQTTQDAAIALNTAKNSYPSADATKLAGIEAGAEVNTVDSVNGETGAVALDTDDVNEGTTNLYFTDSRVSNNTDVTANTAKNSYPAADATKLAGIETGAEVNDTAAEIKTKYESNANTNAFTDAEKTTLGNQSGTNTGDQDLSSLALKSNVLELDNTTAFTPDADYEPATKKYVDDNSGGGASSVLVTTSTSYTLVIGDAENILRVNVATAGNLNVPTNASVAFPIGTKIYVGQMGAGTITAVAASGVTINTNAVKTPYQHGYITLMKVDTDVWDIIGGTV